MSQRRKTRPAALTIAGSDSGGGAGVQADLKTFGAVGVHGTSAITCVTAQNPREVRGIRSIPPGFVLEQIEAVCDELKPRAAKTGMLPSREIVRTIAKFFTQGRRPSLVVDPVMVATSGARLLKPSVVRVLQDELLPLADLTTPNLDEAEILSDQKLRSVEDLRTAARKMFMRYGCAVLVKGGHLRGMKEAADIFFDGRTELLLTAPFVRGVSTHGTGCTYSAAVTAHLALGRSLKESVQLAKRYVTRSISHSAVVAGHMVLG